MLWVEKYRPKKFEDVVGLASEIPDLLRDLPHLLFVGKPGTGKTTTAKIIINNSGSDYIILNASDERGIDVIRNKVKSFAMTKSSNNKLKIVFLDEFDYLTHEAQNSLRNLMETYHKNVRFVCSANYENKIVDALKSRFMVFHFDLVNKGESIKKYLKNISTLEGMNMSECDLLRLMKYNKNDLRKCVNMLQRIKNVGGNIDGVLMKHVDVTKKVHEFLKSSDFLLARQTLLDANVEYDNFLEEYHEYIMNLYINKDMSNLHVGLIVRYLADAVANMNNVINKEILVEDFLVKVITALKK